MKNKLLFRKAVTQLFLSLCLMLFCTNTSWGQTIINGPSTSTYTVPAGIYSIKIEVWGGGGAGGSVKTISPGTNAKGGGGAGGGFATKTIAVNPGDIISYTVGGGGVSSTSTVNNTHLPTADGGNTTVTVSSIEILKALGGPGGNDGYNSTATTGGIGHGGQAPTTGNTGDTVWYGGNGGILTTDTAAGTAGAGGGSAGRTGNGGAGVLGATVGIAGAGTGGADGGKGQTNAAVSTAGTAPGAGGGGARAIVAAVTTSGSAGAAGRIVITAISNSVLSATGTTTAAFLASTATASASQSFSVSGTELTANLVVSTASTDFELSADNFATAGASSISLSGATVSATTIYVRLKAGLAFGSKTATVSITSTGASAPPDVSLSGTVTNVFYYDGSGLLSDVTNWGVNADGTGTNPALLTDVDTSFVIANGPATTDAAWTLGTGSKVIVGNGASATLTVANTFPITGTIDATATGSVVWQHVLSSPTFGILANASEVHLQPATTAEYVLGTTSYGKLFVDGAGKVGISSTSSPTVRTSLTVALGSTLEFPVTNNHSISMIAGASVTINGTVRAGRQGGLLGISPAANASGATGISILFADAIPNLTFGTSSTIDYYRTNAIQTVSVLPSGKNYANLTLTEINATAATTKSIAGAITVNGTLTVDLAGKLFTSVTSGANNITLASGATINLISGTLNTAPTFAGTVNVSYNGLGFTKINAVTTISSTAVTLASANAAIVAGMAVTGIGLQAGTTVASISGTALVLSAAATADGAAVKLSFATGTAQTTGFEVPTPASNALNNLTINNSAGLILAAATKGNSIIANTDNTLTLSTADLLDANVQVNGASELTLNVSANQANLKQIVFSAPTTAKLKLIATSTSTIAFANSSAQNWGTGTVEITGFVEGNIRFGSSNSALTSTQLGLIKDTADLTKTFKLSDNGYLYYSTTIIPGDAFVVTSDNPVYLATGAASTYVITTTAPNTATSFALGATALPAGLTLNTATGAIEGTPTTATEIGLIVPITLSNAVNSQAINFTFNIKTRTAQAITWTDDLSGTRTYGDAAIALTATTDAPALSALSVSYSSSNTAVATISGSTLTIVGPGTTTITASQAGNPDYSPATNLTKELVVNAKALTIADAVATPKIYNQSTTAAITGTLAGGLVGADVVTLVLSGTFADANAGADKPVTSTSTLAGADAAKYSLTQPTGLIATISKKDQTLAGIGGQSIHILGDADYYPYALVTDANATGLPSVSIENPNYTYISDNTSVATVVTDANGKEMIHIVGLGTAVITASLSGTSNFNESPLVPHTLTVLPVPLASWDLYNFNVTNTSPQATSASATQSVSGIITPTIGIGNHTTGTPPSGTALYPFGSRYRFNSSDWPYAATADPIAPINIATGKYMSVVIQGNPGKSMSLSSINASFRGAGSTTNEMLSQFAYSTDGVTFTAIGTPTSFNIIGGIKYYSNIDLSGIAALQNLPSGATVTLRYYASGKYGAGAPTTNNGRQWGFSSEFSQGNTRALIIGGSVATAALVAPVVQNTNMCKGALNVNPSATALNGYELLWYTAATGGTPTTTAPVITATKTFYVAQRFIGDVATNISARVPVTVTVLLVPATVGSLITSDAVLCKHIGTTNPVIYTAASGATSYNWTVPQNVTIVSGAGTNVLTVNFSSSLLTNIVGSLGVIGVKAVDGNGCISATAKTITLTTKLPTAPTALVMTSLNETPHFKGIITPAVLEPATPAVYGLVGLNTLTAGIKKVGPYMKTNTEFTLTAPEAPTAASYLWTLNGATQLTGGNGRIITVKFNDNALGTIGNLAISVQSEGGCGNSTLRTLTLARAIPSAPTKLVLTSSSTTPNLSSLLAISKVGPYTGTDIAFTLTATPFTTQGATATSYAWILPTGVTCETAHTEKTVFQNVNTGTAEAPVIVYSPFTAIETASNEITVKFGNATKGIGNLDLLVFGLNGSGNSLARKLTLSRALPTAPTALVLRDGATVVTKVGPYTAKETPLTLTATPFTTQGAEATSFSWVLPAGVNVTAGVDEALLTTPPATVGTTKTWTGTSSVLTINLNGISGASMTSIPLSVYAVNGAGTSAAARILTVTSAAPATPTIVGSVGTTTLTTFSSCETAKTYTATAILGATYTWVVPTGASIVGASNGNVIVVDYSTVTAAIGASAAVTCSATNGTGTSATKSLTVKRVGAICSRLAPEAASATEAFSVVAYPNPSTEGFKVTSSNKKSFGVQVYDMLGRSIEKRQMTSDSQIGSNYAKGIYNVIVNQGANVETLRVIKN